MIFHYVIWNAGEFALKVGNWGIRWYSLMICLSFLGAQELVKYYFKKEGRPVEDVNNLSLCILTSALLGARLGEVLFYNPIYYFKHPLEAILPFRWNPTFQFTGYHGLSYHGALLGATIGTLLYANYYIKFNAWPWQFKIKKKKRLNQSFIWLTGPVALGVTMGFFVRIGNFFNSEIVGTPTHKTYGVFFARSLYEDTKKLSTSVKKLKFVKDLESPEETEHNYQPIFLEYTFANTGVTKTMVSNFVTVTLSFFFQMHLDPKLNFDLYEHLYVPNPASLDYTITQNKQGQYVARVKAFAIPRHPIQLYESAAYLVALICLFLFWKKNVGTLQDGMLAGLAMVICYSCRFALEFLKEPSNILIKGSYPITMGHLLSFITVVVGIVFIVIAKHRTDNTPTFTK